MNDLYVQAIRISIPYLPMNLIDMFNDKLHVTYTYLGWCAVIIAGWHWPRCKMSIVSFLEWLVSYVCYLWRLHNFPLTCCDEETGNFRDTSQKLVGISIYFIKNFKLTLADNVWNYKSKCYCNLLFINSKMNIHTPSILLVNFKEKNYALFDCSI